jgi:dipeptidyl aminopeptidase/acylaminoacyl peptidase
VADPVANLFGLIAASVSSNGLLLYSAATPLKQFTWVDRAGKKLAAVGEPLDTGPYRLSADGRRLATTRASGLGADLWLMDVERGVPSRFTFDSGDAYPVWSPDGRTILYRSAKGLSLQPINGTGVELPLAQSRNVRFPTDWSRDGRFVLFDELIGPRPELWAMPMTPDGKPAANDKPKRYAGGQFGALWGRFSPDSRWVAYESDESGRAEVYIDSFPEPHGKVQISTSGGTFPQWGPGDRELFYASPDNKLTAVSLKVGADSIKPSAPSELFAVPSVDVGINPYEAAPDGQRFLVFGTPRQAPQALTVIVNWPALLKNGIAR